MHRDSHYSLRHHGSSIQQAFEPNKPDLLALHYHHIETPHQYSLFPSQTLMPTHDQPLACETGLEVGTCEAQMVSRRDDEGMNEWDMLERIVIASHDANAPSVHPVNQLSLRGEMDFWGYGK